jgi:hypothetical protein
MCETIEDECPERWLRHEVLKGIIHIFYAILQGCSEDQLSGDKEAKVVVGNE